MQQQAFPQVGRAHARRIQRVDHAQSLGHVGRRMILRRRDLLRRQHQVPVFVQIADDGFGRVADCFGQRHQRELGVQMIAERYRRGKKCLERRLFDILRSRALVAGVQIFVEIGAEIDLVERIGGGFGFDDLGRLGSRCGFDDGRLRIADGGGFDLRAVGLLAIAVRRPGGDFQNGLIRRFRQPLGFEQRLQLLRRQLLAAVGRFLQDRVLSDLGRDHLLQLQPVQLEQADHLDQPRRQDLLLLDPDLQPWRKRTHGWFQFTTATQQSSTRKRQAGVVQ